jgi:CDP-diacylglycerol--serine O-phosphatidyltransferase
MRTPDRRPTRTAYVLPTAFTAGNILLGFLAILRAFEGAMKVQAGNANAPEDFATAAKMIGIAFVLDGLDGRIARMTNTVSDFGREMDSLADVITFGLAPAVLAVAWGIQFAAPPESGLLAEHLRRAGYFVAFLYLLCGSARLARFNVQTNPIPKNPGRPDRKYFVGLPIPAAAGMISALVYVTGATPLHSWIFSVLWMALLALLAFLMVSTWRYRSFKDLNLLRPRAPLTIVLLGSLLYLVWYYSEIVLFVMATAYVSSGILVRIGGLIRRNWRRRTPRPA